MAIITWDNAWNQAGQWTRTAMSYVVEDEPPPTPAVQQLEKAEAPSCSCIGCLNPMFKIDGDHFVPTKFELKDNEYVPTNDPKGITLESYKHGKCALLICKPCYDKPENNKLLCPCCRQPIVPHDQPLRTPAASPSLKDRFLQVGKSFGAYISIDLFLITIPVIAFAAAASGLVAILDSTFVQLFLEGPILGLVAGAALGALSASAAAFAVLRLGSQAVHKISWRKPWAHRIVTIALVGISALVAYKVAHVVGFYLVSQWIAHCVALNQVSSVLDLAWKVIPRTTSIQAGFSSPCAMTAVQVTIFGIATTLSMLVIWIKRVLQEVPKQWNAANRRAPNAPAVANG